MTALSRRGVLAALGMGAASTPIMGPVAAAAVLGIDLATNAPMPVSQWAGAPVSSSSFFGSPLHVLLEAQRTAEYKTDQGQAYPHMKSWGRGFRTSVVARDEQTMQLLIRKIQDDEAFRDKLVSVPFILK